MMKKFTPITQHEKELLQEQVRRTGMPFPLDLQNPTSIFCVYSIDTANLFTNCIIRWNTDRGQFMSAGSAKRTTYAETVDEPDESVGYNISFSRAVREALYDNLIKVG